MAYSDFWSSLNDEDTALDAILTGYVGKAEDMPIFAPVVTKLKHKGSILDFGCGAGRNLNYLKEHYESVYGYDFPNMLNWIPNATREAKNVYLLDSMEKVCVRNYDEILLSLVLQHIHPEELDTILKELSLLAPRFIIHSRVWVDFTFEPILPLLEKHLELIEMYPSYHEDEEPVRSPYPDHFVAVFKPKGY
jgi:SAM-dependent methyltransferase